ncbi:hypothetical protein F5Y04DRAFT_280030 [Hypomontagnella monticulosa]|nr:hypothetical protein F5Y04DRAFT_280030 [Hypomontagnella monticulosa]
MFSRLLVIGSVLTLASSAPTDPALGLEPRQEACSNYDATLYYLKDCSNIGPWEQKCHAGGAACTPLNYFPSGFFSIRVNSPHCETHLWSKEKCGSGGRYKVILAGANSCINLDKATYGYQVIC